MPPKKNVEKTTETKVAKKPVGRPKQSLARVGTKAIARTVARRTVTGIFGTGLLGSIMNAVVSTGIRQTDKIKYNDDFGVFHK